jgi:xanthine/CO dehydrogenase XdhC/CoxF family maturation factor
MSGQASILDATLTELCQYYAAASRRGEPLALATIIRTEGSTYRKSGARVLISSTGDSSCLLSGGCVEADLVARAQRVIESGRGERVVFDTRGPEDLVFGSGLGCEGVTEVWLAPAHAASGYAPLPYLRQCLEEERAGAVVTVIGGQALTDELGRHGYAGVEPDDALAAVLAAASGKRPRIDTVKYQGRTLEVFVAPVTLPPALLLCGGGPDAVPVVRLAESLGWRVSVVDHRPAYATPGNFPATAQVILACADTLSQRLRTSKFDAAVIMSHHMPADIEYLRELARDPPQYIGLLGPAPRRARLFEAVGPAVLEIAERIHAPVGLKIGANSPASIAVSIIAQIHAVLSGNSPEKKSESTPSSRYSSDSRGVDGSIDPLH